jgi:hypothetical protein
MDDTVHMSEDAGEVGITGEITAVSPPPRPTVEAGSSVGVGSLSSEVADFLKEFDRKAPNPHPEQYFWRFNGPLVPFGDFWVPNDCSPYLCGCLRDVVILLQTSSSALALVDPCYPFLAVCWLP